MPNCVFASCLYPSVEHAIEEERKIRTDGIGHVGNFVKEVDVVGPLVHCLEVTFAPYLILSASLLILKYLRLFATATASPRATRVTVPTTLPSSPWPPLVLDVKAQLWFAD